MKSILVTLMTMAMILRAVGQKRPLQYFDVKNWPAISHPVLSNNGEFVSFEEDANSDNRTLFIQSTVGAWKFEAEHGRNPQFTEDGKLIIFNKGQDSIAVLHLGTDSIFYIQRAVALNMPKSGKGHWISWANSDDSKVVTFLNLVSKKRLLFCAVKNWTMSGDGRFVLIDSTMTASQDAKESLNLVNLDNGADVSIWKGFDAGMVSFDNQNKQLVFIGRADSAEGVAIFRFAFGDSVARQSIAGGALCDDCQISDETGPFFSPNGKRLFFYFTKGSKIHGEPGKTVPPRQPAGVNVWRYRDMYIQTQQSAINRFFIKTALLAKIDSTQESAIVLNGEKDEQTLLSEGGDGQYALSITFSNDAVEANYSLVVPPKMEITSLQDGSKRRIEGGKWFDPRSVCLSPGGRFVLWYDGGDRHYYTYEPKTGKITNITCHLPTQLFDDEDDHADTMRQPFPMVQFKWGVNDTTVFLYDRYDIWKADPLGLKWPVNLTKGFGRKNSIVLRFLPVGDPYEKRSIVQGGENIYLVAFERATKRNGFYTANINGKWAPKMLTMGDCVYYLPPITASSEVGVDFAPQKAKDTDVYLLERMSVDHFPNLFLTSDFKTYRQLTTLEPQKANNWLSVELVHWTTVDGHKAEGLLYKPENFASNKTYPMICYYYEKLSDGLFKFPQVALSDGPMNIAFFVSNGYLVFVPNIYYRVGHPAESAFNSVVSGVKALLNRRYIDKNKIGLQGHSFGGYETNCIITQTSMFAAAVSAAGISDLLAFYGSYRSADYEGWSFQKFVERGQIRMGASPWERPDLYVENSPILKADKVTTPVLIMHNLETNVPWAQGFEWFTALRRLNKKVWLLQYDQEDHGIAIESNQLDYSMRVMQFFDHYLKNASAPKWMTDGISVSK